MAKIDGTVVLPAMIVGAAADKYLQAWDSGGEERTRLAIETKRKAELLQEMPKTTGFLWWKRELTPEERQARMQAEWNDRSIHSRALAHQWAVTYEMGRIREKVSAIRSHAASAKTVDPATPMHVLTAVWNETNTTR